MNIALLNVSGRLSTDGSRLISALLKRAGHEVSAVYFSRPEPLLYERRELEALDAVLSPADVVLISVYSSYAVRAIQATEFVHEKYPGTRVFWGGPHCISVPELGLRYADGVCFSEGDEAVVELMDRLAKGGDYLSVPNFAFRTNGTWVKNSVLPPFRELDSLPYYDFSLEGQYVIDGVLSPVTKETLKERFAGYPYRIPVFYFMTSRGCPHSCAYCNNCRYTALWGKASIRLHSVERVISELEFQLSQLDFVQYIAFGDDDFFVRPLPQIEHFAKEYRKRIGLPFGLAFSARTFRTDKMEILLESGLEGIQIGVQTASQRVLTEVYNRALDISTVKTVVRKAADLGKPYGLNLHLDFIIDNPYESRKDVGSTLDYILSLPWKVRINVFFLAYFPGTPIYEKALADGYILPYSQRAFRPYTRSRLRYQKNWETFLILMIRMLRFVVKRESTALRTLLGAMGSMTVRRCMAIIPGEVFSALARLLQWAQARILKSRKRRQRSASGASPGSPRIRFSRP